MLSHCCIWTYHMRLIYIYLYLFFFALRHVHQPGSQHVFEFCMCLNGQLFCLVIITLHRRAFFTYISKDTHLVLFELNVHKTENTKIYTKSIAIAKILMLWPIHTVACENINTFEFCFMTLCLLLSTRTM